MKKIEDLKDLFIEEGRELFNAQEHEINALSKLRKIATSHDLKATIRDEIKKTWKQQGRIETAFKNFEIEIDGEVSEPFAAIINKKNHLINRIKDSKIRDMEIVNTIQYINHFKIAGYTTLSTLSDVLDDNTISRLFHTSLEEERKLDKHLIKLSTEHLNKYAKLPV